MADLLDDLGAFLVSEGVATALATDVFLGYLPDSPDVAVALVELPGTTPEETMGDNTVPVIERPRVQVFTRAAAEDYPAAKAKAVSVWRALSKIANETVNGTYYVRVAALDSPAPFDRDDEGRVTFVANYQVWRSVTP